MNIDDEFLKKFHSQIFLLENMEKAVQKAIGDAQGDLKLLEANRGKKVEDVAQFTGAPISTIKTRMHYARGRLAEMLAEAGVDRSWATI